MIFSWKGLPTAFEDHFVLIFNNSNFLGNLVWYMSMITNLDTWLPFHDFVMISQDIVHYAGLCFEWGSISSSLGVPFYCFITTAK